MKRRKVTISLNIKVCYRWLAIQPWGEVMVFMNKPVIFRDESQREGRFVPQYWRDKLNLMSSELTLVDLDPQEDGEPCKHWRKTLRKI